MLVYHLRYRKDRRKRLGVPVLSLPFIHIVILLNMIFMTLMKKWTSGALIVTFKYFANFMFLIFLVFLCQRDPEK